MESIGKFSGEATRDSTCTVAGCRRGKLRGMNAFVIVKLLERGGREEKSTA